MKPQSSRSKINYPYLPAGKEIKYVAADNIFMVEARMMAEKKACAKQPLSSVIVKNGKIIGKGSNAGIKVKVCPRVLAGSPTGENYGPCKSVCRQAGHSEITALNDVAKRGKDAHGADVYLWGHWWCCEPCWDAMISAGIRDVYLQKGSEKEFLPKNKFEKIYISGALTKSSKKAVYEDIANLCMKFSGFVYVPHLCGTDPIKDPDVSPKKVWDKDYKEVSTSTLTIAYVGSPSLGVGAEIEIARESGKDVILWWLEGEKVSRLPRGNPSVRKMIEAKDKKDLLVKLQDALEGMK